MKQKASVREILTLLENSPMLAVALDTEFSSDLTAAKGVVVIQDLDQLKRLLNGLFSILTSDQTEDKQTRILAAWLDTPSEAYRLQKEGDLFLPENK